MITVRSKCPGCSIIKFNRYNYNALADKKQPLFVKKVKLFSKHNSPHPQCKIASGDCS